MPLKKAPLKLGASKEEKQPETVQVSITHSFEYTARRSARTATSVAPLGRTEPELPLQHLYNAARYFHEEIVSAPSNASFDMHMGEHRLSVAGINFHQTTQMINELNIKPSTSATKRIENLDMHLKTYHKSSRMHALDIAREQSIKSFDNFYYDNVVNSWESTKDTIRKSASLASTYVFNEWEAESNFYWDVIHDQLLGNESNDLSGRLLEIAASNTDDAALLSLWDAVHTLISESSHLSERERHSIYEGLHIAQGDDDSTLKASFLIDAGIGFLQHQYYQRIQNYLRENSESAVGLGKMQPAVYIREYTRFTCMNQGFDFKRFNDSVPLWPQIYFLVRCGFADIAAEMLENSDSESDTFIRLALLCFAQNEPISDTSVKNRLRQMFVNLHQACNIEGSSYDFFEMLVVGIISRQKVDMPDIFETIDDWLFAQLCTVVRYNDDGVPLGSIWKELNPAISDGHIFSPYSCALMYILTLQFERAVDFLAHTSNMETLRDAAHIGYCCHQAGYLRVTDALSSSIFDSQTHVLNLGKIFQAFVARFVKADQAVLVSYLVLLPGVVAIEALKSFLIANSAELNTLIGYVDLATGETHQGLLFRILPAEYHDKLYEVCSEIGEHSVRLGRTTTAINAMLLGKDYDRVAILLNSTLLRMLVPVAIIQGDAVMKPSSERQEMIVWASDFIDFCKDIAVGINIQTELELTLNVALTFDAWIYRPRNAAEVLSRVIKANILPLETNSDYYKNKFLSLPQAIRSVIGDLLMIVLQALIAHKRGSPEYKVYSFNLMSFAAQISNHIPKNINMQLTRLSAKFH
ncbi:hypothetical protein PCE1_001925 [Barthelona sp. PCE]